MASPLKIIHATCPHDCPDTCSMLVTVQDGKALKLRGNPNHPITRGFLCGKVASYIDRTYHPTRLLHPLKRIGAKGSARFQRISWDEAIQTVCEKLQAIIQSPIGPQAILPYSYAGTMGRIQGASLDRRFFHALGASLLERTICATAGVAGSAITLGSRAAIDPEACIQSKLIIHWGSNTSVTNSHLWALQHQARKNGAQVITIDPFRSKTAEKSDWWIPIRPGTDAALALGIMHVIFRDQLEDQAFLKQHTLGHEALRQRALAYFPPAKVAEITEVDTASIEKLASLYAKTPASLIRLNYGLQRHGGGGMAVRTITCLPALTGAWKHPGGGAFLSTSAMYPLQDSFPFERKDLIPQNTRSINMSRLGQALCQQNDPPVKALVVYNSNPAAICPDQSEVIRGLKREDLFTVVLEQFPTDTTDYADIVLPATTQLEHWDLHTSYGHYHVHLNEPAISPLGEALPNTEIFRRLAKGMGLDMGMFQPSDIDLIREALTPAAQSLTGPTALDGITFESLRQHGFQRLNLPREYSPFSEGVFPTPSGKCELFSPEMEKKGHDPLPAFTAPHESPSSTPELAVLFPLQLLSPPDPAFLNSSFANLDWQKKDAGRPTLILCPQDAASRGILDNSPVRVFNSRGEFLAHAQVGDAVRPGVVVAQGLWWNKDVTGKANANATTSQAVTDIGAGATFFDNLVEVEAIQSL